MQSGSTSKRNVFIILTTIAVLLTINSIINARQSNVPAPISTPEPSSTPQVVQAVEPTLVSCTASASATPKKVTGWKTSLYPGIMGDASSSGIIEQPSLEPSYSLAKIKERDGQPNIFYRVEKTDGSVLPTGTKRILEICDANNQSVAFNTTADTKAEGSRENSVASITMMLSQFMQNKPGTYRLDGFLLVNNKWVLTDRIEGINIVE